MGQTRIAGDWKDVVHIEERTGPRGGAYWLLTLECGHRKTVPRHPGYAYRLPVACRFAPKRVRCLHCGAPENDQEARQE